MKPVIIQNILHRIKTRAPSPAKQPRKQKNGQDRSSSILLFFVLISVVLIYVFS